MFLAGVCFGLVPFILYKESPKWKIPLQQRGTIMEIKTDKELHREWQIRHGLLPVIITRSIHSMENVTN